MGSSHPQLPRRNGLITQRSRVQIPPPQPTLFGPRGRRYPATSCCLRPHSAFPPGRLQRDLQLVAIAFRERTRRTKRAGRKRGRRLTARCRLRRGFNASARSPITQGGALDDGTKSAVLPHDKDTPPDASSLLLATALAGHGRRKAPPVRQRPELAHRKEHRRIYASRDQLELCASLAAHQRGKEGDNYSETGCPPPFLDAEFVTGLPGERNLARRSLRS